MFDRTVYLQTQGTHAVIQTNFEVTIPVKVGDRTHAVTATYSVIWGHPGNWGSTMDRSSPPDPHEITDLRITKIDGQDVGPGSPFRTNLIEEIETSIFDDDETIGVDPITGQDKTSYDLLVDHADEVRRASEPEFPEPEED